MGTVILRDRLREAPRPRWDRNPWGSKHAVGMRMGRDCLGARVKEREAEGKAGQSSSRGTKHSLPQGHGCSQREREAACSGPTAFGVALAEARGREDPPGCGDGPSRTKTGREVGVRRLWQLSCFHCNQLNRWSNC